MQKRNKHTAEFKAKVALEAIKGQKTINELASDFQLHPSQINQWKKQLLASATDAFSGRRDKAAAQDQVQRDELYQQIGKMKVELDWIKKKHDLVA